MIAYQREHAVKEHFYRKAPGYAVQREEIIRKWYPGLKKKDIESYGGHICACRSPRVW
jgi:hypothetical protein